MARGEGKEEEGRGRTEEEGLVGGRKVAFPVDATGLGVEGRQYAGGSAEGECRTIIAKSAAYYCTALGRVGFKLQVIIKVIQVSEIGASMEVRET